ncbi:STE20-like serine/threonine-protein kinase isoform X3 [Ceratina calcarata]|uniref:STE20-like serine/threonine-protein kinase isoform X3 n=1 Tax=Ceratina calcarata TaxID=156304 RepID=A0AAJ7JG78_9HYME|nr:STE20-like serine/threonine-protein kinase isoform X3 [Ceratina calcarata]
MLNIALSWICWLFWAGLPTLTAHPVSSSIETDLSYIYPPREWEQYWIQYTLIVLSITATAFTLVGCLCCRKHRRPKGFQDKEGKCNQEFKDGNAIGQESAFEHSIEGLELNVPHMLAVTERVQFEPLPVEQIISGSKTVSKPKPLPLSTAVFEIHDSDSNILPEQCREWFDAQDLCVPREKLKYLREIGHGWFGKVVEGRADLEGHKRSSKNGSVVVRILTEDATMKEKAWFLGEVTPYLKLHHPNILSLLGFCLETDPYLLLFESCSVGDLKGFLLTNRDNKSREALNKENIPMRMALDIAVGLKHMHSHGFVHTDLSARNCLVSSDLSAKLGDYGTGVEKYPEDYYVVGDRALPIRWSAPESIECTDTTIETREITSQANMWSYAIFLWEIVTWGNRPYHDKSDEEVIQMLLSLRTDLLSNGIQVLQTYLENCPANVYQVIHLCLNLNPQKRPNLDEVKQLLLNEHTEYLDFEQRWERLQGNAKQTRSASLQDLRGSIDSDYWTTIVDDTPRQSSFRLGEPVKNVPSVKDIVQHESSSETEEESWKGRIEKGVYTEKVKQKSKSVTDLMVLVHIDPDSDAELSLVQISEKHGKKKLPATGSDSDLRHSSHMSNEFDEALKKLRDHLPNNNSSKTKVLDASEGPTLLTLTMDQAQTPILRLSLNDKESVPNVSSTETHATETRTDKHVLRLLSKGDPDLPLLRYVPDDTSYFDGSTKQNNESRCNDTSRHENTDESCFSNNFTVNFGAEGDLVDVELWNHALDSALEKKVPGFLGEGEFNEYTEFNSRDGNILSELATSTPDSPRSRTQSVSDKFTNEKNVDTDRRCLPSETKEMNDEEEERKQLSTPDDEQSSDSGFRDKESCEEEENLYASVPSTSANNPAANVPISTEEEQLQILFELDTILDAEYYATLPGSDKITDSFSSINHLESKIFSTNEDESDSIHTIDTVVETESNENLPLNVNLVESDAAKSSVSEDEQETRNVIDTGDKIESNDLNDTNFVSEYVDLMQRNVPSNVEYFNEQKESEQYLGNENEAGIEIEEEILNRNKFEDDNKCENNKGTCGENVENKIEDRDKKDENDLQDELEFRNKNEMRRANEDENKISVTNSFKDRIVNEEETENENKNEDDNESEHREHYEREERNEDENEDEDSSTMSMRSDNSYVSFDIEEEFVTAIRNELLEKLPCAQMAVVEPLEAHDDDDNPSVSSDMDGKQWDDDDSEESSNQGSGGVGISIRYNIYDSPLSPIQEERESTVNSESIISNSKDASIASKESDDVLLVDTRTNKMILLEGLGENLQDDERDTTNGDLSDEENLDYNCSVVRDEKSRLMIVGGGAPLPSPEEESKWQQLPSSFPLPLPLPLEDDLMSTSFGIEHAWASQDEDEDEEEEEEEEEGEEEDENNSSSSGEFVWKRYNEPDVEQVQIRSSNNEESMEDEIDQEGEDEEEEEEEDEEEEEFTPSAWNATLAPHRSALRSPDKTLKSGDDSKSVWFKKQRYHCVYEYPKETLTAETQGEPTTTWEPTSYSDWEEMMDEPRLDLYPIDYDDVNHTGNEEFFVSSSNRPFQFQTSDSKYVSQFFPGASTSANKDRDEVDGGDHQVVSQNGIELLTDCGQIQQYQLGELRHTRDRLKLNLNGAPFVSVKQAKEDDEQMERPLDQQKVSEISASTDITQDQHILSNSSDYNTLPTVPPKDVQQEDVIDSTCSKSAQCDSQGKIEPIDKCSVSTRE